MNGHIIDSKDSKVRVALQNSIKHSGSEGVKGPENDGEGLRVLGPLVQRPFRANARLNFNPFFFFCSKALALIIFAILIRASNHQIVNKTNLTEFAC